MSTSPIEPDQLARTTALIVGVGGLGCPAALALARAGVGRLILVDDDIVDASNLHRQILYRDDDVGRSKLDAAAHALERELGPRGTVETRATRLLPDNARDLVREADIVLEGADNYATKFLAADACWLERRPVVHGAGIRWLTTAWVVGPRGRPCYRCLFEDVPGPEHQQSCDTAGVMGPVVGIGGALMADLALRALSGDADAFSGPRSYDGWRDRLRTVEVPPRPDCPLCSDRPTIDDTRLERYAPPVVAA